MNYLQRALHIESHVARIIGKQQLAGVQYDKIRGGFYVFELEAQTQRLSTLVKPHLQLEVTQPYGVPVSKPWLKSGDYASAVLNWYGEDAHLVGGSFTRVRFDEPDLGSRTKLVEQLLRLGWNPAEYTPITEKGGGGNPRLTVDGEPCPSLLQISGTLGKNIARWYILKHRQSQIKGWQSRVRSDGRLEAGAHTIGTPTYRFRHTNVVNVPKAAPQVVFGRQMRSLFTVKGLSLHERITRRGVVEAGCKETGIQKEPGILWPTRFWKLIGHDASGLELRILAHYIDDERFTQEVSEGDPHTVNQLAAGLPTRDAAKTFIYAFIYGAGIRKIGSIVGGGMREGRQIKENFLTRNPKLRALIDAVRTAAGKGWVKGLDGRRVRIRRDPETRRPQVHKGLNTLIQTGGALVMKYSMVWLDIAAGKERLDATKVIDMHDEGQAEVSQEDTQRYAWLAEESIRVAGRYLSLRCPLDAEAKVGKRWSETH